MLNNLVVTLEEILIHAKLDTKFLFEFEWLRFFTLSDVDFEIFLSLHFVVNQCISFLLLIF